MKRISVLSLAAACALSASAARGADLSQARNADWSGLYGGVHYGFGFTKFGGVYHDAANLPRGLQDPFLDGPEIGAQIGFNLQSGAWVYGLEADIAHSFQEFAFTDAFGDREKGRLSLLASLRARVGIASGASLIYLTGGLGVARGAFEAIVNPTNRGKRRMTALGGVMGAGLEYAMTEKLSVRGEALRYMFYKSRNINPITGVSDLTDRWSIRGNTVFRVGLNLRLNGGAEPAPAAPPAPVHDWSGFYGGVHGGYGFTKFAGVYHDAADMPRTLQDPWVDGLLAGGQIGYNMQSEAWVWGVEADITWSGQKFAFTDAFGDREKGRIDYMGSLRARLGIASGRALMYLTGGAALAHGTFRAVVNPTNKGRRRMTALGGVMGAGLEYAMTEKLSVRGEALHYMFCKKKNIHPITGVSDNDDRWEMQGDTVFRIGLNWRL